MPFCKEFIFVVKKLITVLWFILILYFNFLSTTEPFQNKSKIRSIMKNILLLNCFIELVGVFSQSEKLKLKSNMYKFINRIDFN